MTLVTVVTVMPTKNSNYKKKSPKKVFLTKKIGEQFVLWTKKLKKKVVHKIFFSNCDKTQTQIVTKLKSAKYEEKNSKTQIVTKLKNLNDKNKK